MATLRGKLRATGSEKKADFNEALFLSLINLSNKGNGAFSFVGTLVKD